MPSYEEALREAKNNLRKAGKETTAAEMLMLHFAGLKTTELYLRYDEEMPYRHYQRFHDAIAEHIKKNRPVQYIIGSVFFLGHKINVNEKVLIPRHETEELANQVLLLYDEHFLSRPVRLADIGTGSGCIAIAIKKEAPAIEVYATDISHDALETAKENADRLAADITFLEGDLLSPLEGMKFDIIVANPPYIPENEAIEKIVFDNEPHLALFGGSDGLLYYRRILETAKYYLNNKYLIAFEHAYDTAASIRDMAVANFPGSTVKTVKDMQGCDRMTFILNI